MQVQFNYQLNASGQPRTPTTVSITELVEYVPRTSGGIDYAVVKLAGSPGAQFGTTPIGAFPTPLSLNVTILQHPQGLHKKVHAGWVNTNAAGMVTYTNADTLGGSSGSGVLSNVTGFITAVHTEVGCTSTGGANKGVPISAIYPRSPSVRQVALDPAKLRVAAFVLD